MKKYLTVTIYKNRLIYLAICIIISFAAILTFTKIYFTGSQVFSSNENEDILKLEKENFWLKNLLSSLILKEQKIIYEDEYRNIFMNSDIAPPPSLPIYPLRKVIAQGVEIKFKILSDDQEYRRPLYDPDWKGAYYRGWLYLPDKNIEARHRIFAFSLGASDNYDIFGSLGYKTTSSTPIDNHHNINFLIYGFDVKSVKAFQSQVALIGEPKMSGAQVVSIVQNDILPEGMDTKDYVFQLSTPKGYEVDFLYHNIIRYEYLMEQIKEHTVHSSFAAGNTKTFEALLRENAALKKELSFFIPYEDELITQQTCGDILEITDIPNVFLYGKAITFNYNYRNPHYKRPLYDPQWITNYKRMWCYIPSQIELNLHRFLPIPQGREKQYDFFGTLGFHENHRPIDSDRYGLMVYNFDVSKAVLYKNQLLLIGVPSRTGAEILTIDSNSMKDHKEYLGRLVTPDNSEFDCSVFSPQPFFCSPQP